jgi:hypothetical protein
MRNLKILGLALVAVLAMSAVAASAAQADFTYPSGTTKIKATQPNGVFTTTAGNAECGGVDAEAAVSGTTATDLTFTNLVFTNCMCLGRACDVTANGGCTITLTTTGESHLCPTGGSITLTVTSSPGVSLCTIHVTQHTVNGITFSNTAGTPNDIDVTVHATNITYETIGGGGKCGTQNTTFTCGLFDGDFTLQAFNAANVQQNLTKD